jgi:hypothetical protein
MQACRNDTHCLAAKLRPGNVHSAEDWDELLLPEIERQQRLGKEVVFRADAAFAKPEISGALEERVVKYAIRIPGNDSLERDSAELLTRPVGRPSHKPVVWSKTGGRLVKHARYYGLFLAEEHLNRRRFSAMPGRIALLPVLAG